MLYLILSRIRGGKTTYIHNLIGDFVLHGRKDITLIVPEQFSFTTERIMLEHLGAPGRAGIDIESFTSLAEKIVPPRAQSSRRRLDDSGRAALMSIALDSVKNKLSVYGRHTASPGVIGELVMLDSEMKQCAVGLDAFSAAGSALGDCLLKRKIDDISLALSAYEALCEQSSFDSRDILSELDDCLAHSDYFNGRLVFIDAFRGFTKQELNIIEKMICKASAVYVTLCTDNLQNSDDETDIFAHTKKTAKRLIDIAHRCSVQVAKPQYLSERNKYNNFPPDIRRYNREELAALEAELFSPCPQVYEDESSAITLCSAPDIYSECEYIACTAKKLIRENGYRCRDIAVLARSSDEYEAPLRAALRKCGVSVFEDKRQPINASALISLVDSAADIAADGFATQNIMRYLKTGLAGLNTVEIAELENYCFMWQISGAMWLEEWAAHPRGFYAELSDADAESLKRINELRKRTITPLLKFRKRLDNADGEQAAGALWSLLSDIDAKASLRELAVKLDARGETSAALEQERIWDCFTELLDCVVAAAGTRKTDAAAFRSMLELMLSVQTMGSIPQGLDEITIGSADRVRTSAPKVVFVAGANDGVFPAVPSSGTALNDNDRRTLLSLGLEMSDFGEYKLAEEKLIAYCALCCASDRLFVTYPARNVRGEELMPSELVSRIAALFPKCVVEDTDSVCGLRYVEGEECAFERLAREKRSGSELYGALSKYFMQKPAFAGRLAALERAGKTREYRITDSAAAQALFGGNLLLSASKVETFYKCKFEYFCKYGLGAAPRKTAKLDPMQRGNIIHNTLECLLRKYRGDSFLALSDTDRLDEIKSIMMKYLDEVLAGSEKTERFMSNYNKLAVVINDIAKRLVAEFSVSSFRPADFELTIDFDGDIGAYALDLGRDKIFMTGRVDRLDTAVIDGKSYFRVIDYKSSDKPFALSDVVQGLNMQMLVYLFAVWQNGGERYGDITPAGILYFPAKVPTVHLGRNATDEDIVTAKAKKCTMKGIVLDDARVVIAMDKDNSGVYVPASIQKDGKTKGSLIGLEQLRKLKERADSLLVDMALSLREGDISAIPCYGKNYDKVCEQCDYKTVCFYEDTIERRCLNDMKAEDVLKALEKEGESDE